MSKQFRSSMASMAQASFCFRGEFQFRIPFNPCVLWVSSTCHPIIATPPLLFPTGSRVAGCPLPWRPASAWPSAWRWSPSLLDALALALGSCFPCRPVASGRPTHRFQGMPWTPWTEQLAEPSFSSSMFAMCWKNDKCSDVFPEVRKLGCFGYNDFITKSVIAGEFLSIDVRQAMSSATIRWQVW